MALIKKSTKKVSNLLKKTLNFPHNLVHTPPIKLIKAFPLLGRPVAKTLDKVLSLPAKLGAKRKKRK
jgi:hypothetical protein